MNLEDKAGNEFEWDEESEEKRSRDEIFKAPLYEFYIAGVQHHKLKTCINEVEVGDILTMVAEPTNKYDPNAIRLEFQSLEQGASIMVGYVPGKISASVSATMVVSDLFCEVIELTRDEKPWKQIKVAIKEV